MMMDTISLFYLDIVRKACITNNINNSSVILKCPSDSWQCDYEQSWLCENIYQEKFCALKMLITFFFIYLFFFK